ncbi:aminotransferase class I/II-fold pyridoxal phosphate-dependent enzyme [Listeria booriae]|uniref:Aminotransferase class I/II-fold pyridoxal phosphate-dependent enzyme n=1 Tax=Listeria booriae TaxID=1552123 RepID=A0A841XYM4_9LIST|nr:aminotransferase class I/II-fold pyridoxal phosphate-dependent enzyme [Listeria booriae]MBC1317803.1 aminotransferase class I/II-fold pyridoxal phosphate-dependent enzyme [Listeria booriae]MBC1552874.1 aminotransferase class I/II-fold pyridoxal phosphate-dependent enzyme [Listeria booriae]MBC2391723.1 aminotransferase class I/II-fold pyridoxal phosphate-dependent enzyme [Listeria booriae]
MRTPILLSTPHMSGREQVYVQEAFDTNWIAPLGANVTAMEEQIKAYTNANAACVTSSGTAAIHLALRLLEVGVGDTVFCASFTFIASANPIKYMGADAVFIDSEPETWNMSPEALGRALQDAKEQGQLPKAVIVVHLYGQSAKMDEIVALCEQYGVPMIEDAAESLGSTYKGQQTGTFGDFGVYSFNGNKIITTSGGGALVAKDPAMIEKAVFLATQAREEAPHYQHEQVGYNYRMSNVSAGIGRGQMEVLGERIAARQHIYRYYERSLSEVEGITMMPELADTVSNHWLTTITLDVEALNISPYEVMEEMKAANIETRVLWKPLHLQPVFEGVTFYPHDTTQPAICEQIFKTGLCLPSGSNLTEVELESVTKEVSRILVENSSIAV